MFQLTIISLGVAYSKGGGPESQFRNKIGAVNWARDFVVNIDNILIQPNLNNCSEVGKDHLIGYKSCKLGLPYLKCSTILICRRLGNF